MAERITVTMSKELYERLTAVKERFNVSGICQEAIERRVKLEELMGELTGDASETIERLRAEKEDFDSSYVTQGRINGLQQAKKMHYDRLVTVVRHTKEWLPLEPDVNKKEYFECVWDLLREIDCFDDMQDYMRENEEDDSTFNADNYLEGWVEGVVAFYREIKDKL